MAAELFTLPFRPALSPRGLPIAGAKLHFFVSGSLTPTPVYADAALTVPLSNPVTADSAGKWPSIYTNSTVTYRVQLKDANGNLIPGHDVDPYYNSLADAALDDIAELQSDLLSLSDSLSPNQANTSFWANYASEDYYTSGELEGSHSSWLSSLSGTFTRSDAGYLVNSSGVIAAGVANTPRITHDAVTLDKLGTLYEGAASNLWPYSMIPGAVTGPWYYSQTNTTITGAAVTGIDGGTTAGTIKETTTNGAHNAFYYDGTVSVTSGQTYPVQFWFKGLSRTKFRFDFIELLGVPGTASGGFIPVDVDLTTGTISTGWELIEQADGFWRMSCVATATGTGVPYFGIRIKNDSGALSYAGDNAKGIVIGAIQLEAGTRATSYIHRAAATAASRAADELALTIPTGVTKLTVVYDDLSIDVLDVAAGAYTLDPADLSRGTIAKLIAADMTDYSYVTKVAGKGPGNVTLEQADIDGLRSTDSPTFALVKAGASYLYSPSIAFQSFSDVTGGVITGTPRGVRIGFNAAASVVSWSNSNAIGADAVKTATTYSTSNLYGDSIASQATGTVSAVDGVGNELFNNLTTVVSSVGMGNLGFSATGLSVDRVVGLGPQVGRWHGGLRTVAVGYKALFGSSGSTGTLTDCTAVGDSAGASVTGNRSGLGLYGAGVEPPTATTDNYLNLENVLQGSTTGGAFSLTTKTGGAATLTLSAAIITGTTTTAPSSGQVRLFRKDDTIRQSVGMVEPDGTQTVFGASPFFTDVVYWLPAPSGTGVTLMRSVNLTATGTATAVGVVNTTPYLKAMGIEYLDTVASTSSCGGFRHAIRPFNTDVGFTLAMSWGPATGVANTTQRAFCGMANSISAPSDVEPSSQIDIIGMGWDAADTNVQVMHNDGSGTATKIDLGASFPVPTADQTQLYDLQLRTLPGVSSVTYLVTNRNTGATATGTITANLPTGALTIRGYCSAGGTSSVSGIGFKGCVVEVPRG